MRKRAIAQIIACSIIASILTFILIGCTATGITSSIVHDTVDAIGDPIKKTVEITEKAVSHLPTPRIRLFGCAPIITIDDNDLVIGDSTGSVPSGYSEGDAAYDAVPTTLDIDWASGRIYIDVRADAQGVRLYECAGSVTPDLAAAEAPNDVADPNRMIHRFQNDTLKIEQFRHGITWVGVHETYQKTLVVILPETTLDKLNIDAAAVEIFLNGCKADRLDLDTAAGKVNNLMTAGMPSIGQAMAAYVGQNYGYGNLDRIRQGTRDAMKISTIYSIITGILAVVTLPYIIVLFFDSGVDVTEYMPYANTYVIWSAIFYLPLAMIFIYRNTMQGCGWGKTALMLGIAELIARLAFAITAMKLHSFTFAAGADAMAWLVAGILSYFLYRYILSAEEKKKSNPDFKEV